MTDNTNTARAVVSIVAQVSKIDLYEDGATKTTGGYPVAAIEGYIVPSDPMDDLQCDSCQ
ncbi:hypothetical protein QMG83_15270 [Salinibacterium sp. G-O1]|uniref:hypothetical protein n=1 Tax=Salinibacterium sp. G-O1 TaxID=3046208 RepID=UPI0024B99C0C|nr:hypothetical protein [Salinibacterium sp. G-O1]MDJ0336588.1 hypothetical protein [Salinibacterium sp. G-O1]